MRYGLKIASLWAINTRYRGNFSNESYSALLRYRLLGYQILLTGHRIGRFRPEPQ